MATVAAAYECMCFAPRARAPHAAAHPTRSCAASICNCSTLSCPRSGSVRICGRQARQQQQQQRQLSRAHRECRPASRQGATATFSACPSR
eukprot:scaffold434_cov358-Prasinococcus_capsulatus_cf.AAC.25